MGERETAYALEDRRYDGKIVPLMYRACDLGRLGWLRPIPFADFRGDFDSGCRALLRVLGVRAAILNRFWHFTPLLPASPSGYNRAPWADFVLVVKK